MNTGTIASTFVADCASSDVTVKKLIAVSARNRDELIKAVKQLSPKQGGPFLRLVLPCGNVREWEEQSVPSKSIQCYCPDLPHIGAHWFILYSGL